MDLSESTVEENRRIRRAMRDLVALSTLPAVWIGLSREGIARSLAQALLNTLSLDLIYIRLGGAAKSPLDIILSRQRHDAAHDEAAKISLAALLSTGRGELPSTIRDPFGTGMLQV